ncbi:MAG: hypothetical protein KIS66_17385 [Fimbriimonadaceae bacterium]|nr:hypothetical protein [Fimbriimonadaceae bacterium]
MRALAFVTGCVSVLLIVAVAVAYGSVPEPLRQPGSPMFYYLLVPVLAAALLIGAAIPAGAMFAPFRFAFPLNLTLPIVYGVLLLVSASMVTQMPSAIERLPPQLLPALNWFQAELIAKVAGAQCGVLTVFALFGRKPRQR